MAAKKQAAKRKPVRAETGSDGPQSPDERKAIEAQLTTLIGKYAPDHAKLVGAARRALQKRLPAANEIVYDYNRFFAVSYSPTKHGYEGVFTLRGDADGIRLYVGRGKELPDPAKVLRKAGGNTRWIDLESASTLTRPDVKALVEGAIALNAIPFARTGRGAMILSPSSAKKSK